MLTFQILDGGESFYRPLEGRGLTIGRAPGCDIQLQEEGVLDRHARVAVAGEGEAITYWIQAASADAVVKVNGKVVREAELALGDRIELGRAVLVLGQQVRRPATASDVLEQTSSNATRARGRRDSSRKKMAIGTAVLAAVAVAVFLWQWSPGASILLPYIEKNRLRTARKTGRFEEGREILHRLRENWARQDATKRVVVEELKRELEATAKEFARLREEVRQGVLDKSRVEQLDWLKDLKRPPHSQAVREAANLVAGRLTEFREVDRAAALARLPDKQPADAGGKEPDAVTPRPAVRPPWLDARLADVRQLHGDKQHARALEMLRQVLPDVPVEYAGPMRDLLDEVRQATRTEMEQLVEQARELRRQGKLSAAIALLRAEVMRFPTVGPLAEVYHSLSGLEADLELGRVTPRRLDVAAAPKKAPETAPKKAPKKAPETSPRKQPVVAEPRDPAVPKVRPVAPAVTIDTSDRFRGVLLRVQDAEAAGDLDAALARARDGASFLKGHPQLAAVLNDRAADLACLVAMSKQAQARIKPELGLQVTVADGRVLPVLGMDGHLLRCGAAENTVKVGWFGLAVDEVAKMLAAIDMPPDGKLALAVLWYRSGDADRAEQVLARLAAKDKDLTAQINDIVSRGRNEHVDAEGYALVDGKFVAKRFLRVEKLARKFGRRIGQLQSRDKQARDKVLAELLTGDGDTTDAVALALREEQRKLIERIKKSPFQRSYGKVAVARERLDKARAHALALIFDHVKYFYPYKPPAVSGEKASEYWKVQKEVDKRVNAVKKIWLHDKAKAVVPKALLRNLSFLRWVNDALAGLGEPVGNQMQQIAWVETLPAVKVLTAANFCKTVKGKQRFLFHRRVEELNEILGEEILREGEHSQVAITNGYRLMMGRSMLAVSRKIHRAARGHADEMGALGYFGHFSPNPERRTPFQRMRLEDYSYGVSENCAKTASAADAHRRWLHSSGHHRNILMPSHTEFGVGNSGPLWVQNFGMGKDYLNDEHFPPARSQ
ncbi:MAG: FHA domain-containing protein [Planctomycetota bacterium]|jgi:uncharacterized protein YkwD